MLYDRLSLEAQDRILTASSHYDLDHEAFTTVAFMEALRVVMQDWVPPIDLMAFSKTPAGETALGQSIISSSVAREAELFLEVIESLEEQLEDFDQDVWFTLAEAYYDDREGRAL